jgi:hypothetical protein
LQNTHNAIYGRVMIYAFTIGLWKLQRYHYLLLSILTTHST